MQLGSLRRLAGLNLGSLLGTNKQLLGLDIGSSAIKLVQVKESRGGYKLQKFGIKLLEPELIVDGTVMDTGRVVEAIKELLQERDVRLKSVAMSISGHSVIVKKITVPPMLEDQLEDQIRSEAEQHIPLDINDVNIDFHVLSRKEESADGQPQMSVLLVAAKKDKLTEFTELVKEAGLTPCVIDVDAFAIANMYGINYESSPEDITALVNIGASVMNINVIKGGECIFTRDIAIGGNRYSEAIQREVGSAFEEAEAIKKGERLEGLVGEGITNIIANVNAEVSSEIVRSLDYFRATSPDGDINRIMLCGGSAKARGLIEHLSERTAVEVELVNPFNRIDTSEGDFDPESLSGLAPLAAVGVGLALRRIGDR